VITDLSHICDICWVDKSDIRFVLDLSWRQISLNPFFRPVLRLMDYIVWHDNSSLRTGSQVERGAKIEKSSSPILFLGSLSAGYGNSNERSSAVLFIYLFIFCVVLLSHLLNKEPHKTENHLN